ncbi:Ldh family oxidoreductase [Kitasatospora sp. NPDC058444]|uniref:Ldh family oxidoreductase n=1 Tax=Kitasatospora sp. NPDC058444 TaxID=3346504 RepID=UPI003661BE57
MATADRAGRGPAARLPLTDLLNLCAAPLLELGAPPPVAEAVAAHLVDAEVLGHTGHGLLLLPSLVRDVRTGRIDPGATPHTVHDGASLTTDLRGGFAQYGLAGVVDHAVGVATRDGQCLVRLRGLRNSGRLGAYVERAATAGTAALLVTGSAWDEEDATVATAGAHGRVLGTNPMAFAAPAGDRPLVVDLATSATTMGRVRLGRVAGGTVDPGAVLDRQGRPSTAPADFYSGGAIAPLAGHKGTALALLVAALSALAGDNSPQGRLGGGLLLVLATGPDEAGRDDYRTAVGAAVDRLRDQAPTTAGRPVRTPGQDHAALRRRARAEGLAVPGAVLDELQRLGGVSGWIS